MTTEAQRLDEITTSPVPADSPAGIREVYNLVDKKVGEVAQRLETATADLGARLETIGQQVSKVVVDQEHRVTELEVRVKGHDELLSDLDARVKRHDDRFLAEETLDRHLEDEIIDETTEEKNRLEGRRWVVGVCAGLAAAGLGGLVETLIH